MENQLKGQVAAEQIAAWKQQHKTGIYAIEVDGHIGYFKKPNRHEMNCTLNKAEKNRALDIFEELANLTFIGGSSALLTEDELFFGVVQELKVIMDGKKARLVNL
jgi:hypothetical protein